MKPLRIHISAVCGVATSNIALAFHKKGHKVSGSDKGFFPPASTILQNAGVPFYAGYHPELMIDEKYGGKPEIYVAGTAGGTQNPETEYARQNGIKIMSDAEVRGQFFAKENSIVCAGTWGKTSSTAMLSHILKGADYDPSYLIGGFVQKINGSDENFDGGHLGDSEWSVIEGDEYKSSPWDNNPKFTYLHPTHLLLTAVSWDHADMYPTPELYFEAFRKLVRSIPSHGIIVANMDNEGVCEVLKGGSKAKLITYGSGDRKRDGDIVVNYTYSEVKSDRHGLSLIVSHEDKDFKVSTPMLGNYQAENITGCFAMAHKVGISPEKIADSLKTFNGLERRLEKKLDGDNSAKGVTVISDIAHSAEKASATLSTLRDIYDGKIYVVYEPNIGGRRIESISKYDNAMNLADAVYIPRLTKLKVKEEEHPPLLGDGLRDVIAKTHKNAKYIENDEDLVNELVQMAKKGDVIAFLGSHGFRGMIDEIVKNLSL